METITDLGEFAHKIPRMTILSDHPARTSNAFPDHLGLQSRLAAVFDILRHKRTKCPITVAIYGDWGTGKTSAMRWIENNLAQWNTLSETSRDGHPRVHSAWFDPWRYQTKDEVWRGIIAEVILSLFSIDTLDRQNIGARLREAAKLFGAFLGRGFLLALSKIELTCGPKELAELKFTGDVFRDIYEEYDKAAHPEKAHLNQFENTLREWVTRFVKSRDGVIRDRIVIFIDDLDRCLPAVTLEVLEALKLYLNIEPLLFVVGLDKGVVDAIVRKHYQDAGVEERKSREYLNKLFQVEIQIPPSETQVVDYLNRQIESLNDMTGGYWEEVLSVHESRISLESAIRKLAEHNPREIKRLLNSSLLMGRAAADNVHLNVAGNDTPESIRLRFTQGVQCFLLQRFVHANQGICLRLFLEKKSLLWFEQISQFARSAGGWVPTVRFLNSRYSRGPHADQSIGRDDLDFQIVRTHQLSEDSLEELDRLINSRPRSDAGHLLGFELISDELFWNLLLIPFSASVAQSARTVEVGIPDDASSSAGESSIGYPETKALVMRAIHGFEEVYERRGRISGVSIGSETIDHEIDGLSAREVAVLAARRDPDLVSYLSRILLTTCVEDKKHVLLFSMELSSERIMQVLMCSGASVDFRNMRIGFLSERDFPALTSVASKLANAPLYIVDATRLDIRDIRQAARQMSGRRNVDLVIIHSFSALAMRHEADPREPANTSGVSAELKALAIELGAPVIVTALAPESEVAPVKTIAIAELRTCAPAERTVNLYLMLSPSERLYSDEKYPCVKMSAIRPTIGLVASEDFVFFEEYWQVVPLKVIDDELREAEDGESLADMMSNIESDLDQTQPSGDEPSDGGNGTDS